MKNDKLDANRVLNKCLFFYRHKLKLDANSFNVIILIMNCRWLTIYIYIYIVCVCKFAWYKKASNVSHFKSTTDCLNEKSTSIDIITVLKMIDLFSFSYINIYDVYRGVKSSTAEIRPRVNHCFNPYSKRQCYNWVIFYQIIHITCQFTWCWYWIKYLNIYVYYNNLTDFDMTTKIIIYLKIIYPKNYQEWCHSLINSISMTLQICCRCDFWSPSDIEFHLALTSL